MEAAILCERECYLLAGNKSTSVHRRSNGVRRTSEGFLGNADAISRKIASAPNMRKGFPENDGPRAHQVVLTTGLEERQTPQITAGK
jgi:hypothetical protein